MKKRLLLSLCTVSLLNATEVELSPISVQSTTITEVAQNAQTSADVAVALSKEVPGIDMSRRSGIANDVFIRGQKRDNISIEVDGTKVYGACPNRMDPPISHVVANQINSIEVIEGPYDVTSYGNLSGGLKIATKKPSKKFKASVNLGFGAWEYKKFGATASGGNDIIRLLVTASTESSDQYRDGNGDNFAQQLEKKAPLANQYQVPYREMQAYTKNSMMAKAFITTAKNQELRLSVTANRSDNVLYPNSPMDAIYDDSNIYSVTYNIDQLTDTYKNMKLQYYYSDVDHPMSTEYRNSATNPTMNKTNHMWTEMQGIKLSNTFDLNSYQLLLGLDGSKRIWRGEYVNNVSGAVLGKSIDRTTTKNGAIFAKLDKHYNAFSFSIGGRFDNSHIDNAANLPSNTYNSFGANLLTNYALNKENKIFFDIGQAYRVPDARELYFKKGTLKGTPTLKQVRNQEVDLGYKTDNDYFSFKMKLFYSKLHNYIYINSNKTSNIFQNIDATVYGTELSGSLYFSDDTTLDFGASYKRGKKDTPLEGQSNSNLADMAPLRGHIALDYEYANHSIATIEMQASQRWDKIDSDNGEQVIAGWAIFNAKLKHAVNKKFDLTFGVNNLLNKSYAQSNTYVDLTLLTAGGKAVLFNEPGRYFYTNLDFKF
jgi:iron complex outermembrane receptor protein